MACGPVPPQDPFNLAQAKDNLNKGHHWYLRGCHREASRFFGEGLAYARLADSVPLIVMSHNSMGAAFLAQGRLNEAAVKLSEALELSLSVPEHPELDSIYGNLGSLAFEAGRPKDAEEFWQEALNSAPPHRQTVYLANLARLYKSQSREAEYLVRADQCLTASQTKGTAAAARADALALGAQVALDRGDSQLAETYLNEALNLDRETENPVGLAQDLELQAELQLAHGQIREGAQSLDRAFYLWAAVGHREAVTRVFALLEKTSRQGFPKELAHYLEVIKNPEAFDPLGQACP
jgi:tetratricopeptide (TPR) repeat protein